MSRLRGLAAFCLLLALAGCWTGDAFYAATEAAGALPAGDYATTSVTPDENGRVRVAVRPDGFTLITPIGADGRPDPGDAITLGFAPIPGESALFAAWLTEAGGSVLPGDTVTYGLLSRAADGVYVLFVPSCAGSGEIARAAGAQVIADGANQSICHFPSRAALEAALKRLPGTDAHAIRLTPQR